MPRICGRGCTAMAQPDYLIVGAGLAGSVCARQLAEAGRSVLVVEQRAHVAGNAYDYYDDTGVLVHKYGAHIFHTNSMAVVDYLSQFTAWRPYEHRVMSSVNGALLPIPMNRTTLAHFRGDIAAARRVLVEPYTRKQWGPYADQLDPTVVARITPRWTDEDRYFTDTYQQMPASGYTAMVNRMLAHPQITVRLRTSYWDMPVARAPTIYSGPIDEYFGYRLGLLPYRSARFAFVSHRVPQVQPVGVINHPSETAAYTRVVEFKHLTGQSHPWTTVAYEYPTAAGDPYWPVPTSASAALYSQYKALADATPGVHFVGRLGRYAYLDMHQVVAQALTLTRRLLTGQTQEVA